MPERAKRDPLDCTAVAEILPAYLNRSLESGEAGRIEAHLATCAACRREERDARTAWALFEGHLPVELLLDYALEEPVPPRRRAAIESHLARCERCAAEVAVVREEHDLAEPAGFARRRLPRPRSASTGWRLQALALAASLAAAVASVGWLWTWRQSVAERAVAAARVNLPVVELLPVSPGLLRHGRNSPEARAMDNRVELAADAEELVLVLLSGGRSCKSGCVVEIYAAGESRPERRMEDLAPSPDSHLTLLLPADWIPPERSIFAVRDRASGEVVAEFPLALRRPPPGDR